jgi:hypothetical protein
LHPHYPTENFHALHAPIQIYPEPRAALGAERAVRRVHLQRFCATRKKRVKGGVTLAKVHTIDLAPIGSEAQRREVE